MGQSCLSYLKTGIIKKSNTKSADSDHDPPGRIKRTDIQLNTTQATIIENAPIIKQDTSFYTFSKMNDAYGLKTHGQLNGSAFTIEECNNSTFLLMDSMCQLSIDYCTKCTFILGPCEGSLFLRDCSDCIVFASSRQFRLRDCKNMTVFLYCESQPCVETSSGIQFHCLQLSYPFLLGKWDESLEIIPEQCKSADLSLFRNLWWNVYDFSPMKDNYTFPSDSAPVIEKVKKTLEEKKCHVQIQFSPSTSVFPLSKHMNLSELDEKEHFALCFSSSALALEYCKKVLIENTYSYQNQYFLIVKKSNYELKQTDDYKLLDFNKQNYSLSLQ